MKNGDIMGHAHSHRPEQNLTLNRNYYVASKKLLSMATRFLIPCIALLFLVLCPGLALAASDSPGDDATVLVSRGFLLLDQGRYNDALTMFNQAIALDPYSSRSWYGKGLADFALNDYPNAINDLDRATELSPKDEPSWTKKGEVYRTMGRNDLAITAYKRALLLNPNNDATKNALEALGVQATPTTVDYRQYPPGGPSPTRARDPMFTAVIMVTVSICAALTIPARKYGRT